MTYRDVLTDTDRRQRLVELEANADQFEALKRQKEEEAKRQNRDFVQVYPKGWKRLQGLIRTNPSAARVYAFLAENIDGTCGAVVVSQDLIAESIGVHRRTIIRLTKQLEDDGALVRIKVGTGIYAYALDPEEVWKSWDEHKDLATFRTRTLVKKSDRANNQVKRKLKVMMEGPELPLGDL
jgi:DNA-binding transcriptional regulator YhcF (GntR family)